MSQMVDKEVTSAFEGGAEKLQKPMNFISNQKAGGPFSVRVSVRGMVGRGMDCGIKQVQIQVTGLLLVAV